MMGLPAGSRFFHFEARYIAYDAAGEQVLEREVATDWGKWHWSTSQQYPFMHGLVTTMREVGGRSGELEEMLDKVAQTYDEQVESTVSKLTALLEPLLILVMVGIVLVIILATLMPLLQITNSLS